MLAQRAASEGPRWTRAVEDRSAPIPREVTSKLGGAFISFSVSSRGQPWLLLPIYWRRRIEEKEGDLAILCGLNI